MTEKKVTSGELTGWLDDNDIPHEIDDEGKLTVKGDLGEKFRIWVKRHKYTSLPDELSCVDGDLWLDHTCVTFLGGLTSVKGSLWLQEVPITSLDDLTSVGGNLWLKRTSITSLGNLTSVGGNLNLQGIPITSLGDLSSVGGWLDLQGTFITSLGSLTSVGGDLDLQGTSVTSLDDLPEVGKDLYLDKSQFQLLTGGALQKVGGKILYRESSLSDWGPLSPSELETIVAENEARESLQNTRETCVDWSLYDR